MAVVLVGTLLTTIDVCSNLGTIYNATQTLTVNGLIYEYTTIKSLIVALYRTCSGTTSDVGGITVLRLLPSQITHILSLIYLIQSIRGLNNLRSTPNFMKFGCSMHNKLSNKKAKSKRPKITIQEDIELHPVIASHKEAIASDNYFEDFVLV